MVWTVWSGFDLRMSAAVFTGHVPGRVRKRRSYRDGREDAHTATSRVSNRSSGTAKPSSSRAEMYPSMASLIFEIASSLVRPWEIQPGRLGHSATQELPSPGISRPVAWFTPRESNEVIILLWRCSWLTSARRFPSKPARRGDRPTAYSDITDNIFSALHQCLASTWSSLLAPGGGATFPERISSAATGRP